MNEIFRDLASIVHDQGEVVGKFFATVQSLFSTRRICSREQRKRQLDWLATTVATSPPNHNTEYTTAFDTLVEPFLVETFCFRFD